MNQKIFKDITGLRFGSWQVLYRTSQPCETVRWKCVCDCGTVKNITGESLRLGKSKSCGCMQRKTLKQQFDEKWIPVTESGCWIWTGHTQKRYGYINVYKNGKRIDRIRAHRLSYMLHRGEIPKDMHVLHRCDTPECVNPNHLFLGTNIDNVNDRIKKKRTRNQWTGGLSSYANQA